MLAAAVPPRDALAAMAKAYGLNVRPGDARITEYGNRFAIVELRDAHSLLDSNHVGAMERLLRPLWFHPDVRIHEIGPGHAELPVRWG